MKKQELIKVVEHKGKEVVSARGLYKFLQNKERFTQWMDRMLSYGFTEGVDYQAVPYFVPHSNGIGGTKKTNYALTVDTAKEISMIQRSDKGKQARQYFIERDKKLKAVENQFQIPQNFAEALRLAADTQEENERLTKENQVQDEQLKLQAPKVEYADKVLNSASTVNITTIAKELGITGQALNKKLHEKGIQFFQGGLWNLYAKYADKGYTTTKTTVINNPKSKKTAIRTVWTEKGREFIHGLLSTTNQTYHA